MRRAGTSDVAKVRGRPGSVGKVVATTIAEAAPRAATATGIAATAAGPVATAPRIVGARPIVEPDTAVRPHAERAGMPALAVRVVLATTAPLVTGGSLPGRPVVTVQVETVRARAVPAVANGAAGRGPMRAAPTVGVVAQAQVNGPRAGIAPVVTATVPVVAGSRAVAAMRARARGTGRNAPIPTGPRRMLVDPGPTTVVAPRVRTARRGHRVRMTVEVRAAPIGLRVRMTVVVRAAPIVRRGHRAPTSGVPLPVTA